MTIPILVLTPNKRFGELIDQVLSERGDFSVSLTSERQQALETVAGQIPKVIIFEPDPEDPQIKEFIQQIRSLAHEVKLVLVIPEEYDLDHAVHADLVQVKPVNVPNLVSEVEKLVGPGLPKESKDTSDHPPAETENPGSSPDWLADVNVAAQYLTRLSLESSAKASMITRGDQIWAYAGELPGEAADELARIVSSNYEAGGDSDLARFIRLDENGGEYMLYATGLGGPFVLASVFAAEMPFSKIRAQASILATGLVTPPPEDVYPEQDLPDEDYEMVAKGTADRWPMPEDAPPPIPTDWIQDRSMYKSRESLLDELLEDAQQDAFTSETVAISRKSKPAPKPRDMPEEKTEDRSPAAETLISASTGRDRDNPETEEEGAEITLEPVSPSMYSLTYACVLIPRFPDHELTGEVPKRLSGWITHLCVAFGWRLEHLSIRPDYVQWQVNVPPNTSPGYLMRTVREHTSRRMFIEFPYMAEVNLSGDFWAPGYLVLGSPQLPPLSLIEEFIQNTRTRQGIEDNKPA